MGCWITPLTDKVTWAGRFIFDFIPSLCVALNFVLTPSCAMFRVCEAPAAPLVRSIAVPDVAFEALDASLIVLWSSLIIKYEPSDKPPIAVPHHHYM